MKPPLPVDAPQRHYQDVGTGDELDAVRFPLSIYRLVMAAGANRDFNSIHHNAEYARTTGAPDMYANTILLLGMWERAVRGFIGPSGTIRSIQRFRMASFNLVGDTTTVTGRVVAKYLEAQVGHVRLEIESSDSHRITVGPGIAVVTLPLRQPAAAAPGDAVEDPF